ncbi:GNAT family N-acetyltransferase [Drancourtella massiliensis]|nr:GNAT family N-acetyltransferase [Drancourtella massiliensis]
MNYRILENVWQEEYHEQEKSKVWDWHFQPLHIYLTHEERGKYTGKEKVMDLILEKANGEKHIGAVRICDFEKRCVLKQIFILPEYQGYGYAQEAIKMVESFYTKAKRWHGSGILRKRKTGGV